jgi:phage terminase large subunit-like protein
VLDEYADMKSNVWEEIIDPALMDVEGSALFIGTPKGKNHFYKIFMGALEHQKGYDGWEAFHFKSMDNPYLNEKELERMMTSSNKPREIVRQEIEASFVSGGGKVLKPEWFKIVKTLPSIGTYREGANHVVNSMGGQVIVTVDLAGFHSEGRHGKRKRLDESVVCTTYVTNEDWYVMDMQHGQWDVRETALRIIRAAGKHSGTRLGVEAGVLLNAVGPYLEDYMREFNRYVTVEPLRHGNTKKLDRIQWALQGRAERGRIKLVKGDWNEWFLDQVADFPDPLSHDDGPDALAYVDQLSHVSYADFGDVEEWEPLDIDAGY